MLLTELLLPADFGGHSLGSLLPDGRWQRADPDGDRLRDRPAPGASPQPPGGQSPGQFGPPKCAAAENAFLL